MSNFFNNRAVNQHKKEWNGKNSKSFGYIGEKIRTCIKGKNKKELIVTQCVKT